MLTVKQTAEQLGVSRSKVYQLASRRELAHYRVGGKLLFADDDVAAYLRAKRVEANDRFRGKPPVTLEHIRL